MQKKKRMQLHISGINMLNECGIRFQFRYIDNIKRPPNLFLMAGTATDASVGADLQNKIERGVLLTEEEVSDVAQTAFSQVVELNGNEVELVGEEEKTKGRTRMIGETLDKVVRLAKAHHSEAAPAIMPVAVNRKFAINMDAFMRARAKTLYAEAEIIRDPFYRKVRESQARALNAIARKGLDFAGEWDIREERLVGGLFDNAEISKKKIIRDTKTSKKSPSADAADDSEQLSGYALAEQVIHGTLPDEVTLDFLIDLKGGVKYVEVPSKRTAQHVEQFLNRFANAVHALHSGVFVPTKPDDWRCSEKWCGYWHMCPYAKRPVSTTVAQPKTELVQIATA